MSNSLKANLKDIYLETRTSKKTNNTYQALVIEFNTGYKKAYPVFDDTAYILGTLATAGNH